jgi:hypothetical protein
MKIRSSAGLAAGFVMAVLAAAPAHAAPVTVNLRIEGPTSTIFEGPVTTDVRTFHFTTGADTGPHQCDGTTVGGTSPGPVPTRAAVVAQASETAPFSTEGTFSSSLGVSFTTIAGQSVAFDPGSGKFLGEYNNDAFASLGACADPVKQGDDVLFAYTDGSEPLLKLVGPVRARPGLPVTVRVIDMTTRNPVAGASVDGQTTGADGLVTVGPFATAGDHGLKATMSGAVRSNRLPLCVTSGSDGACGTLVPDTTAPSATIAGIRNGQRFSRKKAPRELHGTVSQDPSGLWAVKIRLTRKLGKTCWYFSGSKERFLKRTCGKKYAFKVGDDPDWSYLLPSRLPRGSYVLDTYAIDNAFNHGSVKRVRFSVR